MIKVLIADDNNEMAKVLETAIKKHKGYEVVSIGADGASALGLYIKYKPKVVFLDIEMPIMDGIECAKEILAIDNDAYIIFSTAHTEYMKDAFELYAFDYLIKPFKMDRLNDTLKRISQLLGKEEVTSINKIDKLMLKNRKGIELIDKDKIIMIQREGTATVVITENEAYSTSSSLGDVESKLDSSDFMRTHKSYIVNLNYIDKIVPYGRWTYIIKFKEIKEDALITASRLQDFEEMI